jgi:preprotein translocase subunit SecF
MELFKSNTHIQFLGRRQGRIAAAISIGVILIAFASIFTRGFNFGIDFTGGTLVEVGYEEDVGLERVRTALEKEGYGGATVQHFGTLRDVLIRVPPSEDTSSAELSNRVFRALSEEAAGKVELRRVEFVGPQVGDELTEQGGLAVLYALIGILIYVALRFEWRFAVGAVVALIHDVVVTVGLFSLLQIEFDLPVLAAVLAVIGYSLNDTIVVFDRIRENFRKVRKGSPVEIINGALNQTLSRTIVTSGTTLLVVLALFFLGGEIIHGFALVLLVGIIVGTYSSIYVASSAVMALGVSKEDLMPVKKEGAEVDNLP